MMIRAWRPALAAVAASLIGVACGSNPKPQVVAPPAPPPAVVQVPAPPPPADPVLTLIATSRSHFEAGERELKVGHLERARVEFDRAIDVLLESPYGARTDARMREHFDRLVDRINAYEVTALAQGDGFSEKRDEPASIDEILKIATFPKPEAASTTEENVKADLATTAHDIPIPQNSRVLSYVELFQGRLRDYIQESLTRGAQYLPMIQSVFRAEGLPLDLAYIPIIESGFKTNALSRAKAKGPWQFMRATAVENGLRHDWYVDERSDPEKSTLAAAKYLKTLHNLFDDWNLVLAAYNGGLGRVQRAMRLSRSEDFWKISSTSRYLPRETREYVPLILASIIVAKNPAQYGFDVVAAAPIEYEKVAVPRAVDLRRVAEWTETTIDEIQALNPELRRWTTPIKDEDYEVKVPVGTAVKLEARLAAATPDEMNALKWHSVKNGETISSIAKKLKVSRVDLAEANGLSVRSRLRRGQSLLIPRAPATLLATRTDRPAPSVLASRTVAEPPAAATADAVPASAGSAPIVYRVKRGDTLFAIARLFDTTVDAIKNWNRLRGNVIVAGDRLKIFRTGGTQ